MKKLLFPAAFAAAMLATPMFALGGEAIKQEQVGVFISVGGALGSVNCMNAVTAGLEAEDGTVYSLGVGMSEVAKQLPASMLNVDEAVIYSSLAAQEARQMSAFDETDPAYGAAKFATNAVNWSVPPQIAMTLDGATNWPTGLDLAMALADTGIIGLMDQARLYPDAGG